MLIASGIIFLMLIVMFLRGHQIAKAKEKMVERVTKVENDRAQILGYLPYHGGLPSIPKPQKLNIATTNDSLLLFTNEGVSEKVIYEKCKKVEKFTTRKSPDLKGKSIVLWGPFVGIFLKPKIRHFIVLNYQDGHHKENNLLLETDSKTEQDKIYEKIYAAFRLAVI